MTKRLHLLVLSICAIILTYSEAQTPIGGELKSRTFDASGNPYLVGDNLVIPKGDTVVLKKGVIFLFNNFTGLEVYGSLIVEGKENDPVIFSSVNDGRYNPKSSQFANAFDWNGISIDLKSDDVKMFNFKVCYSVYGIKSYSGKMVIRNGTFNDNGQYNLIINETIQEVKNGVPYTYNFKEEEVDTLKRALLYKQKTQNKKVIVFSSLGVGLFTGGLSGFFAVKCAQGVKAYNNAKSGQSDLKKEFTIFEALSIGTGVISLASLTSSLIFQLRPVKIDDLEKKDKKEHDKTDKKRKNNTSFQLEFTPYSAGLVCTF